MSFENLVKLTFRQGSGFIPPDAVQDHAASTPSTGAKTDLMLSGVALAGFQ